MYIVDIFSFLQREKSLFPQHSVTRLGIVTYHIATCLGILIHQLCLAAPVSHFRIIYIIRELTGFTPLNSSP